MIVLLTATALAAITVDPPPVQGQESTVVVTDTEGSPRSGVTLRVVHRPGLDESHELSVGITDSLGRVKWSPIEAGMAVIRDDREDLDVDVGWPEVPRETALLLGLLVAGAVGAIGWGIAGRTR